METLKTSVYRLLPHFMQNGLVTLYNFRMYRKRHGGNYKQWLNYYEAAERYSREKIEQMQANHLKAFVEYAREHSSYYQRLFDWMELPENWTMEDFYNIPVQSKEDIRSNIDDIFTIPENMAIVSYTGGTTGKSLVVRFTHDDMQNRFAMLDLFRAKYGYTLGKRVAWFNGKHILSKRDPKWKRYWKYDWLHKIRFYSTFHVNPNTARYYIDDLNRFKAQFAVGFPSCMYEIAQWGIAHNYPLQYRMKAIFPTSEALIEEEKKVVEQYFGCRMLDQYASAEGAPFILECDRGHLHIEPLSGFFEVLDEKGEPAQAGELVFTSFTTHGTPLIRYAIGDHITLSDEPCDCGHPGLVVKRLQGRNSDYVFSEERGKITIANIATCVKAVKGVQKFQVVQEVKDALTVKVIKDPTFTAKDEKQFLRQLRQRLGDGISITFEYVDDIPREKSGKYRIVKQSLNSN